MNATNRGAAIPKVRRRHGRRKRKALTLVEFLVVIGIVSLLTSILMPAAQRAQKHARAVVCRGQLHQWSIELSAFVNEENRDFSAKPVHVFDPFWRLYFDRRSHRFLCPMARRYEPNPEVHDWAPWEVIGAGPGSKFTAWKMRLNRPPNAEPEFTLGNYGFNGHALSDTPIQSGSRRFEPSRRPIVVDCASWYTGDPLDTEPPCHDGDLDGGGLKLPCIDRHNGAVNGLFLDWSAGRVGLKGLWTLDWSVVFDPQNAWTRAGGVRPEDWPKWMQGFRDY